MLYLWDLEEQRDRGREKVLKSSYGECKPQKWGSVFMGEINLSRRMLISEMKSRDDLLVFTLMSSRFNRILNVCTEQILCHRYLSVPPENGTNGFLMFSGVIERDKWHEIV